MRRRNLLGSSIEYIFTAETTSKNIEAYGSGVYINITSTANGKNINYSVVSYDELISYVSTAQTRVYIAWTQNETPSERNGSVILKQNESNKTIVITINQAAGPITSEHEAIILDSAYDSTGITTLNFSGDGTVYFNEGEEVDWVEINYSDGVVEVFALTDNNSSTCRNVWFGIDFGNGKYLPNGITIIQMPSSYNTVDGHDYVELRGTKWATMNVNSDNISSPGRYYEWGSGSHYYRGFYDRDYYTGTTDPLPSEYDTATQVMGGGWRMPTKEEFDTLFSCCIDDMYWPPRYYSSYNEMNGIIISDNYNLEKCLFIPFAGYKYGDEWNTHNLGEIGKYWTSNPSVWQSDVNKYAYGLDSSTYGDTTYASNYRYYAYQVRGVHD